MQECAEGLITLAAGLEGDFMGNKYPRRQITVLARDAWEAAVSEIGHATLPWTARRANLFVASTGISRCRSIAAWRYCCWPGTSLATGGSEPVEIGLVPAGMIRSAFLGGGLSMIHAMPPNHLSCGRSR